MVITSVSPAGPHDVPYLKMAPDAEVVVAPKARPRLNRASGTETSSIASTGRRSLGGRNAAGPGRPKSSKTTPKNSVYLRVLDERVLEEEPQSSLNEQLLQLSVDRQIIDLDCVRGVRYVTVTVIGPGAQSAGRRFLQKLRSWAPEPQQAESSSIKVVAKLSLWCTSPSSKSARMSSALAEALCVGYACGIIAKIEPAPSPLGKKDLFGIRITPFLSPGINGGTELRLGGLRKSMQPMNDHATPANGHSSNCQGSSYIPITDGQYLHKSLDDRHDWHGGVVRFEYASHPREGRRTIPWIEFGESNIGWHMLQAVAHPQDQENDDSLKLQIFPVKAPILLGYEHAVGRIVKSIIHGSSVLVVGGLGSGKTAISLTVGHYLRRKQLFHISLFSCRDLAGTETRATSIKETLDRVLLTVAYGTRLGGKALLILDDLDKICPHETELQVGNENGRARQLSETILSTLRTTLLNVTNVSLIITAQSKDSLHQVITGGHIIEETTELKAPNKENRRDILQSIVKRKQEPANNPKATSFLKKAIIRLPTDSQAENPSELEREAINADVDLLAIAAQTDGYMPGDLETLVTRAQSEALTRNIRLLPHAAFIEITIEDFSNAICDFTPASLRNVALQTSSTRFDSVGGLHSTRKILIETLQYPTTYAPLFDQCPLRVRSGLLLYGYPGCGKTLLASAVAGECGLNFISVKGPEILNKYIGASEKSVRDLFERAQAARPCILFFDEFDSIAPKRGHDSTGVTDRVVNQLLTQMDGAEGLSGVYVLAATSRPDLVDPALLRPGRLDKSLLCDMPMERDRLDILRAVSNNIELSSSLVNPGEKHTALHEVAKRTNGYTGADLQAILYNAHLEAVHDLLKEQSSKRSTAQRLDSTKGGPRKRVSMRRETVYFPLDRIEGEDSANDSARQNLAETRSSVRRATLETKLNELRAAQRKGRDRRRQETGTGPKHEQAIENPRVVIQWRHIEASLRSTKSSISPQERIKFNRIYTEFESARNGEMPSGQGSTEIGARSSLM